MKTIKYKTLRGILNQSATDFTFDNFVSGRFVHKKKGWVAFRLSEDAERDACDRWASVLWRKANEERVRKLLNYYGKNYGIFRRLAITRKGRAYYCAGQDYPSEIRTIQNLVR